MSYVNMLYMHMPVDASIVCMYTYMYTYTSLPLSLYIYIYTCSCETYAEAKGTSHAMRLDQRLVIYHIDSANKKVMQLCDVFQYMLQPISLHFRRV